jgi:hypothetical protein
MMNQASRMRQMTDEREAIRIRERGKLHAGKHSILRTEPKQIFKDIFDRLEVGVPDFSATAVPFASTQGGR